MADWAACVVALAGVEDLIDCVREDEPDSQFCSVAKGDDNGVYHPLDTTKDGLLCWSVSTILGRTNKICGPSPISSTVFEGPDACPDYDTSSFRGCLCQRHIEAEDIFDLDLQVYKDARIWSRKAANWVHEICMHTELKNQSLIDGDKGHIDHINKVDRESAYQL
ncbi:unnamed protein product [Alternaria alternata]